MICRGSPSLKIPAACAPASNSASASRFTDRLALRVSATSGERSASEIARRNIAITSGWQTSRSTVAPNLVKMETSISRLCGAGRSEASRIRRLPTSPAVRYWNMARQRYYRPSARCCRVRRVSAERAARPGPHTRGKPRLLDVGRRILARDRFAPDSPLERNGFELPVPRENGYRSESSGFVYLPETVRVSSKDLPTSGTEVSNPLPSSRQSVSHGKSRAAVGIAERQQLRPPWTTALALRYSRFARRRCRAAPATHANTSPSASFEPTERRKRPTADPILGAAAIRAKSRGSRSGHGRWCG